MISIVEIPELVRNKVLGYLTNPLDLLRLRRVCKATQQWISEYPGQEQAFRGFQIRIRQQGWENLSNFLLMGLNLSNIYLQNDNEEFFSNPSIPHFLDMYSPVIRKLKVGRFNACKSDSEFQFFESLTNLEELHLEEILLGAEETKRERRVPSTLLENLKVLKMGRCNCHPLDKDYIWAFIDPALSLEELWHPEVITGFPMMADHEDSELGHIMDYLKKQKKSNKPTLRRFNMKNLHEDVEGHFHSFPFMKFMEVCHKNKIQLFNVDAHLLDLISPVQRVMQDFQRLSSSIVSLVNLQPAVGLLELPNLDKINITSTSKSNLEDDWNMYDSWPKLKTLKINFDSLPRSLEMMGVVDVVFGEGERTSVESLGLTWAWKEDGSGPITSDPDCLRVSMIVNNFPNLRKLKVVGWTGINRRFIRLWTELAFLEEVWLENCPVLGNVGFIGQNPEEPIFLRLTGLKKLTLKVQPKSKITDRCFRDVFRHLKLKEFNLVCDEPLQSITAVGISHLLDGVFADSIERFSFKTWTLANTTEEQMWDLKNKFKII